MNKLTLGQKLVQIRKAMGLTQAELGSRIGVSQRIIHYQYPDFKATGKRDRSL